MACFIHMVMLLGALVLGGIAILYADVVRELVRVWSTDTNYSHGFLIPPIAAFLAWERRDRFLSAPPRPARAGLVVIGASVLALGAGAFPSRIAFVATLGGAVLAIFGWSRFRAVAFPLAILLLMIPLPAPVFERLESPLQIATSALSETLIHAVGIPVFRDGNLLALGNVTLEVAKECSGIRTTISLVVLGLAFGYSADARRWPRVLVLALTVPVVILTNAIRVAATATSAHYYGRETATGFLHDLFGWLAFAAAFATLFLIHHLLVRAAGTSHPTSGTSANAYSHS
ncbi:MAG TPA: exosortase/archaeosortase family protein [Vicinamibacterales bacterium]|nr:exosortase/archaeosortase family protein [Vicinamibacterales bacterium]